MKILPSARISEKSHLTKMTGYRVPHSPPSISDKKLTPFATYIFGVHMCPHVALCLCVFLSLSPFPLMSVCVCLCVQ